MESCKVSCKGYIPERRVDDFDDLNNPFIPQKECKCNKSTTSKSIFKKIQPKKDDIYIVLCFLLFLLCFKFFY